MELKDQEEYFDWILGGVNDSQRTATDSDDDYNPPSMETNVADLEEPKEEGVYPEGEFCFFGEGPSNYGEEDDSSSLRENVKSPSAMAGVCGLRNVGNTCYMNAGLQCLLATPPVVNYFTEYYKSIVMEDPSLSPGFWHLLQDVWQGDFKVLEPTEFKERLSQSYPQFKGSHQHDCQEFLALLLDSMHEELKKMESTSHEGECCVLPLNEAIVKEKKSIDNETDSASSPKSYDSQSSSEPADKALMSSIRNYPIPQGLKCESNDIACNLVPPDNLKKTTLLAHGGDNQNNRFPSQLNIEDYIKDNKTSNVNVNSEEHSCMNNEISFDSEKYSNKEKNRPETTIDNLSLSKQCNNHLKDDEISNKRFKTTNLLKNSEFNGCVLRENFSAIKRIRLEYSEKNVQHEIERSCRYNYDKTFNNDKEGDDAAIDEEDTEEEIGARALCSSDDPLKLKETIEADRYWDEYLSINDTVIARNFQGQFKNTIVCSICDHVSVTFEPFMYLSVPLPDALTRQVELTFVGRLSSPIKMRLNMTQVDNVGNLKSRIKEVLKISTDDGPKIQIVEVFDHHVSRNVDDCTALRYLKDDREIYALELIDAADDSDDEFIIDSTVSDSSDSLAGQEYQTCIICMEDLPPSCLRQHDACDCMLCKSCMDRTVEHHQKESLMFGQIKCPGCRNEADPEREFVTLDKVGKSVPKKRILNLPVVYRLDNSEEADNNKKTVETLGHPFMITVPNIVSGKKMYNLIKPLVASPKDYVLVLVNAQGKKCARCIYHAHCYGCIRLERESTSRIYLQPNDTIGISYTDDDVVSTLNYVEDHETMKSNPKLKDKLLLTECLQAFSEKEVLDENNPWHCPNCQKNQCATKTLTIWRFPDYLIIYLKRFVFLSGTAGAVKLETPVEFGLTNYDLTPFLSGPLPEGRPIFDLYGVVSHFGSVCGGHYTAFTKNSLQWNYFDDCSVTEKKVPGSALGDFSSAYILFYKRGGATNKANRQGDISSRLLTNKFNLDSLNLPDKKDEICTEENSLKAYF